MSVGEICFGTHYIDSSILKMMHITRKTSTGYQPNMFEVWSENQSAKYLQSKNAMPESVDRSIGLSWPDPGDM